MSYDVFLQPMKAHAAEEPMAPERLALLGAVVARHGGPAVPDEYGFFFETADAGFEFYAGAREGGMLALRGLHPAHAAFVFDAMRTMDWFAIAPGPETLLLAHRDLDAAELAVFDGAGQVARVESVEEVMAGIDGGFDGWAAYRDLVVRGGA